MSLHVPWVGSNSGKKICTISVLSEDSNIVHKLFLALTDVHARGNHQWELSLIGSRTFEDILRPLIATKQSMDFVILAVDTSRPSCLGWANDVLLQVDPDLRVGRVMLVSASGLSINEMAVYPSDILSFCSENGLLMVTANLYKPEDTTFLATRLIRHLESCLGLETGMPDLL